MRQFLTPKLLLTALLSLSVPTLATSCLDDDSLEQPNTYMGNFKACWQAMDEHYCYFSEKNVDWDRVYSAYLPYFRDSVTSNIEEFQLMASMLSTVRDGHVNLSSSFNTARYWKWYEDYPQNFDATLLERYYLGKNYWITSGMYYGMFSDSIGYVRYPSFASMVGETNLDYVLILLRKAKGLIIDVRDNGGGALTNVPTLANRFCTKKTVYSYMMHKTGKGHDEFSEPTALYLEPQKDRFSWDASTQPVAVLTNRSCFSATNNFVAAMKSLAGTLSTDSVGQQHPKMIKIIGDRTGGGGGMPFETVLPNGWVLRFSACPILDHLKRETESGIDPDIKVDMDSLRMFQDHRDDIIESARAYINNNTRMQYSAKKE